MFVRSRAFHMLVGVIALGFAILICGFAANTQVEKSGSKHDGVIYRNPRVYNVEYSFEMFPDPNKVDRDKDLKLWVPIPREWDSQKAVKIVSVEPDPHGKYVDPEYGNPMLFWDFAKEPERPSYKVNLKYRVEQYEVHSSIDPDRIGPYDKASKDYILYTGSTHTISVTDKVKELAGIAVGNEMNPYSQAKLIYEFVREKMYYRIPDDGRPRTVKTLLDARLINLKTGQSYYRGNCFDQSMIFVAFCRAVGIPARNILARWDNHPWNRTTPEHPEPVIRSGERTIDGLIYSYRRGRDGHGWAEIYLPNYGWIPVDSLFGRVGHSNVNNRIVIIAKGHDILINPHVVGNGKYTGIGDPIRDGRISYLYFGVFPASTQRLRTESFLHPDPFPADALAEYLVMLYPKPEDEKNIDLYRKRVLRWLDQNMREHADKLEALAQAYKKEHRARYEHEAFICHMLRKLVGDKKFSNIVETYTDLRVKSGEPVSTARFQKIAEKVYDQPLGWFFKQWVGYSELPRLQLDAVTFSEDEKGWYVRGTLCQLNKTLFRLPVEFAIETEKSAEHKTLWVEDKDTNFEFRTANRPKNVLVDPNNDILQIREMPPLLESSSFDEIAFCTITDQDKADWYHWTPLHFAAQAGKTDVVEYLVAHGADVDAKNIRDETPLHAAAAKGHKEIAELLIAKGAEVNAESNRGKTPLQLAADEDHKDVAELLIEHGADVSLDVVARLGNLARVTELIDEGANVNIEGRWGETPLHAAAAKGHKEIAQLLIAKGADVDAKKPGYTPLTRAIWNDDRDMIKLLLTSGADVNFKPTNDDPAMYYSVWEEDVELAELLLAHGAKLDVKDDNGWTVLRHSVSEANRELVEFFLSKGATAPEFHLAACMGNLDLVKSLVEKGIDVDTKDELGWTPLYWATSMGREEVAEFLMSKGAGIDVKISNNRTLLHQAARSGAAKLVELLISKGADSNARDEDDSTPLHSAAAGGHKNIVELLIAHSAQVKAKEESGNTPLHRAAAAGHVDVAEILLASGADINAKGGHGRTSLHVATRNNRKAMTELLLAHGADVNLKDNEERTALWYATEEDHTEIVEVLRKHGAKE